MIAQGPGHSVEVFAPARLHLGFLDLHGALKRKFGSLGLTIEGFGTELSVARAETLECEGPGAARAADFLVRAARALDLPAHARITVKSITPEHVGLGSGTQLGLAVAAAFVRLHGARVSGPALAAAVGRGARSGIGIGAFERGGFLVDGGRADGGGSPPIIARLAFPRSWRLLLTTDRAQNGLSGADERDAFAALPPFEEALAGRLCRMLVMSLLPGLAEGDFAAVSAAVAEIQGQLGRYFAPVQNGPYSSKAVAAVQDWLAREGVRGLGQSSWGPTAFALIESETRGEALVTALRQRFADADGLAFRLVAARNRGADIKISRSQGGSSR